MIRIKENPSDIVFTPEQQRLLKILDEIARELESGVTNELLTQRGKQVAYDNFMDVFSRLSTEITQFHIISPNINVEIEVLRKQVQKFLNS